MRSKRARGEQPLEAALSDLASALNAIGVPWMIIGGIAVIARGVRRMTTDIDAAVRGDGVEVRSLLKALAKKRILPRIDDLERFAAESLVLLLKHQPTGIDLDVSLAWTDFEHEAIAASSEAAFGAVKAPMAQAADLIVFKAIAGRPKDLEDATSLLVLYPELNRERLRDRVNGLAAIAEAPELANGLEAVFAVVPARPARPTLVRVPKRRGSPSAKAKPAPVRGSRSKPKKTQR